MIQMELTEQEADSLRQVLESYLSDLHSEINHTDNRDFRQNLKDKESSLTGILKRLPG